MLEAVALVTDTLLLAVPLDRFRVPLPVLSLVVGMRIAPLLPAILYHLGVEGIGANLFAVIIPAALPLTRGPAANDLLRTISGRLKGLLTVRATAITHQAAPDQNAIESFCPEPTLELESPPRKSPHIETPIEFSTASPPMGLLLIKPVELLLFYTGADMKVLNPTLSAKFTKFMEFIRQDAAQRRKR